MSQNAWDSRKNKYTMFQIINFADSGEMQVYKETVDRVLDKQQIISHLQNIAPVYGPVDPKDDPLFIDAHGYCRLVFAFDSSKTNCLFHRVWPFSLKHRGEGGDPGAEFDDLQIITRGDFGHVENSEAVSAFSIDDKNTKVDPFPIAYNLFVHLSQDANDPDAYLTGITIDPHIRNGNG
jgi:hypothetical protein